MNTIREIEKINQEELDRGIAGTSASWHSQYSRAPWVYVGNLDHSLTEGDVLCVLSQYGELEDIHLVREEDTGKSKGFCFAKYEDARSAVLAVDNLIGIKLCGRSLRLDHVEKYRLPKDLAEKEEEAGREGGPGQAYQGQTMANKYSLAQGQDLFAPPPASSSSENEESSGKEKKKRKRDKTKDKKKKQRKDEHRRSHRRSRRGEERGSQEGYREAHSDEDNREQREQKRRHKDSHRRRKDEDDGHREGEKDRKRRERHRRQSDDDDKEHSRKRSHRLEKDNKQEIFEHEERSLPDREELQRSERAKAFASNLE